MVASSPQITPPSARQTRVRPAPIAAALLTAALLSVVQAVVRRPMLLAERFWPGAGWAEVALLAAYAGALTVAMLDAHRAPRWRRRLWALFSFVFFAQLVLGLVGFERFLMTGVLHLPIPALIVGGPVWRGEGFFMLTLLAITLVFVGPAWCSFLCYIGAWDMAASDRRRRPAPLPRWRRWGRPAALVAVVGVAALLRALGASSALATALGAAFGVLGVVLMLTWSRRAGAMTHCLTWCPIGFVTTVFGRISPFRVRIRDGCTGCNVCQLACRYDALNPEHIERRAVGASCTLCGDCIRSCRQTAIVYAFPGLTPDRARALFLVLVVSLHAVTLGVARI